MNDPGRCALLLALAAIDRTNVRVVNELRAAQSSIVPPVTCRGVCAGTFAIQTLVAADSAVSSMKPIFSQRNGHFAIRTLWSVFTA